MPTAVARRTLGFFLALHATTANAQAFCTRLPFDDENPPGFSGRYAVVGRDAATGAAYTGTMQVEQADGVFRLTRVVSGTTSKGEAWIEACSPDKFEVLRAHYSEGRTPLDLSCYLRFDGDNYTRASCTSLDGKGLEAWYQDHGSLAAP